MLRLTSTDNRNSADMYYGQDVREVLKSLPDKSVHMIATSPPYYGLRDYGADGQIGLEESPEEYVRILVEVMREARRVLRDDGTLWLNLGNSYASNGVYINTWSEKEEHKDKKNFHSNHPERYKDRKAVRGGDWGIKAKDLMGIPWRVAFALQADGWYLRSDIIWCLSGGTWVYARTQKGDMPITLKDLSRLDPTTVKLWDGGKWTQLIKMTKSTRSGSELRIHLRSGERISCTATHRFPTNRGLLCASDIQMGDVLQSCILPEPEKVKDCALDEDAAWFAGLYIAEGSMSGNKIQIAGHVKEEVRWERVQQIATKFGGSATRTIDGNCMNIRVYGKVLNALLNEFVTGHTAHDKGFAPVVWRYSNRFIEAMIDGYLSGDGCWCGDRWRLGFCRNYNLERDLRTACARLGYTLTLKSVQVDFDGRKFPAFRGELRKECSDHHNHKNRNEVVKIQKAGCRQVYDLEVADAPHLFALASGILTHNSKSNPMPEKVFDRPTKSHEYVFLLTKQAQYFYDRKGGQEPAQFRASGTLKRKDATERGCPHSGSDGNIPWEGTTRNRRSVWSISLQPYKEAHFACVDDETEALTPSGWKHQEQLRDGDLIMAYQEGVLLWQPAEFHRYPYKGNLIAIEKRDSSQRLTPNHRCLVRYRSGNIAVVLAENLTPRMEIPTLAKWGEPSTIQIGQDWAELLGWYIAEGCDHHPGYIYLFQSLSANPTKVNRIRTLLNSLNADFKESLRERLGSFTGKPSIEVSWGVRGVVAHRLQELAPNKTLSMHLATGLPADEAASLLDGLISGDGHRRKDGRSCFIQKDVTCLEAVQVLGLRLGYRAQIGFRKDSMGAVYFTQGQWLTLRGTNGRGPAFTQEQYCGVVWCPSVPSGFWLARRKGKPFITGNTFPEELVGNMIKCGSSGKGCCPHCGAPWQDAPTCKCPEHEPVPCTVMDIFSGSATTGKVAWGLGRNYIGIDLNPDYLPLAQGRLLNTPAQAFREPGTNPLNDLW